MNIDQVKNIRRQELLKRLHNKVNSKQATRMNKVCREQKIEELKSQISNGDKNMKDNVDNIIKKVKKKNKKKSKVPQTLENKINDLQKSFLPIINESKNESKNENENNK